MSDDRLLAEMRDWLQQESVVLPDAEAAGRRIASQLPATKQRRRRRWHLPFGARAPQSANVPDTSTYQPTPIPATNGRTPTVSGRTQSMLSPAKAITAGAIVFAVGGAFLISQPFGQQGVAPGAAEAVAPTRVTGNMHFAPRPCTTPESQLDGVVRRDRNSVCSPMRWTASDPRLAGTVSLVVNEDVYTLDDGVVTVSTYGEWVSNEEGEWVCLDDGALSVSEGGAATTNVAKPTSTCTGQGGYEGLSAILVFDDAALAFEGLIFPGDLPPIPDRPADE